MSLRMNQGRNIRLAIAYDGTAYAGWQVQPDQPTVQGAIESAIQQITGETVRIVGAGRTDAGVHALGQVANFRTQSSIPTIKFRPAIQSQLPGGIVILDSSDVADDFHAIYSARSKTYRYLIRQGSIGDPFLDDRTWRMTGPLDVSAMQRAGRHLLGTHDFRSFESHWPNRDTSVRTVMDVCLTQESRWMLWRPDEDDVDDLIVFEITADGFLYNMVRTIVGTLVKVGLGTWQADDVALIRDAQDRSQAGDTAPPQGLYLVHVNYCGTMNRSDGA